MLSYWAEVRDMVEADVPFHVLGHVDYPLRHWPADLPVPWDEFEDRCGTRCPSWRRAVGPWR